MSSDQEDDQKIHHLAKWGHHLVLGFLLKGKTPEEVNEPDVHGWTPLHHAACYGHKETIRVLLNNKADPAAIDNVGWTPLHHALSQNHCDCVQMLLETGTKFDCPDNKGMTPLHHACRLCNKDLAKLLMLAGANPDYRDNEGKSPGEYCPENEIGLIIRFMLKNFDAFLKKEATGQKRKEEEEKRKELELFEFPFRVGWVSKLGGGKKVSQTLSGTNDKWQKRWLKLKRGILEYYETKEDQQVHGPEKRKGVISLDKVTLNIPTEKYEKRFPWSLQTPERTYWFSCDTIEEKNGWTEDLKVTIEHMKFQKQVGSPVASPRNNRKSVQMNAAGVPNPINSSGSRRSWKGIAPLDLESTEVKEKKQEPVKGWIKVSPRAGNPGPGSSGPRKSLVPGGSGIKLTRETPTSPK